MPRSEVAVSEPARPLVVTADRALLDDVLRLAAAAAVEPDVAHDVSQARKRWAAASVVVVGDDLCEALAEAALPRRDNVVLIGSDLDDGDIWRRAVRLGAGDVIFLPDSERWLVERFADSLEGNARDAVTVCVLGGRGGAGASTLAAALAVTSARQGRRTLLLDGDPLGGGIDLLLGCEDLHGLRWPDLAAARGRLSGAALRDALPQSGGLTVLAWDRGDITSIPVESMQAVLAAAQRGNDLVVVDLPRYLDAAAEEALSRATVTLLVVPAEVRATAAAARVLGMARMITEDIRVVVRGPAPARLPADVVATTVGAPLAGEMRPEPGLAAALERGDPPGRRRGPLSEFCRSFLETLPGRDGS
ncbi:hypothetical protein C3Y87_08270 [Carbonactinospora thermoautotrophica]|nr:hypothetical protein [Carbonactinospora thermoautotrophica]